MRDVILTLLIVLALPLMVWRPPFGALSWTWFSLMNPHRLAWGFANTMPFGQMIIGATLLGMLFSKEPKKPKGGVAAVILFVLVAYFAATTLFALIPANAGPALERAVKIQIGTFLALLLLYKREHVIALMWVIAGSIGFYAVKGGLYTIVTLGSGRVWGPVDSYIADNNAFALAAVMSIPVWAFLYTQYTERKWLRWAILGAIGLTALSALGSQSRGALLAIGAMALVTVFLRVAGYWIVGRVPLTQRFRRGLEALPLALFAATIIPLAVKGGPAGWIAAPSRL